MYTYAYTYLRVYMCMYVCLGGGFSIVVRVLSRWRARF